MKSKMFKKAPVLQTAVIVFAVLFFSACGDNTKSETPVGPTITPSSSETILPADPTSSEIALPTEPASSANISVVNPDSAAETNCATGVTPSPVVFPQDNFNDIGEVFKNIQCNEKAIFIVRHAERDASTSNESPLTMDGVEASIAAGQKIATTIPFKYISSGFLRTYQTVYYMAIGQGQYQPSPAFMDSVANWTVITDLDEGFVPSADFNPDTIKQVTDSWYLKDKALREEYKTRDSISNVNEMYSKWIYEGMYEDVYYNLDERSNEILGLLVKDYNEMPKYTLIGSHDQFLMPFVSWATQKAINLIFRDRTTNEWKWVGFLSGIAIIINDKNEIRYAPIRGMENGYGR